MIEDAHKDRQFVVSLSRGLEILSCFTPHRSVLNNGELSRLTRLPCSSVSRLTHTLIKLGYLDYDSRLQAYRLGFKVLPMLSAMMAGTGMHGIVMPHLARLAREAPVKVVLATYEDTSMVVVQAADGDRPLVPEISVGARFRMRGTGMGRAYLAACSQSERDQIVGSLVRGGRCNEKALMSEIEEAGTSLRQRGYCMSLSGWRKGVHGVAAPLYLGSLGRRAVLSCGGPSQHLTRACIEEKVAPLLLRSLADIEHSFDRLTARAA